MHRIKSILCILSLALAYCGIAQTKDTFAVSGSIQGVIRDSLHDYNLASATIAVYKSVGNDLISFQLSERQGNFSMPNLPLGIQLHVVVSYSGYESKSLFATIPLEAQKLNLGTINLKFAPKELENVIVKSIPPVRMNGDTLEFNADAFKLSPNATTEDLLKKLPGVIIWGDGTITVNGKQVHELMVGGKPFFGGGSKVATQNLPKDIVDKVQVYQQVDLGNPMDSITKINISLKKDKSFGYFGKVGQGVGNDSKYETDVALNHFNSRTQTGAVFSTNNVNKTAGSIDTLLRNNTFKNIDNNAEYQTNFNIKGINKSLAAGLIFQHDFIPDPSFYLNNRLNGKAFFNSQTNNNITATTTTTKVDDAESQIRDDNSSSSSDEDNLQLNTNYNKVWESNQLEFGVNFFHRNANSSEQQTSLTNSTVSGPVSSYQSQQASDVISNSFSFSGHFTHTKNPFSRKPGPGNVRISYNASYQDAKNDLLKQSEFISLISPSSTRSFDRRYNTISKSLDQSLGTYFGNFAPLIFGQSSKEAKTIVVELQNHLSINSQKLDKTVLDRDPITHIYLPNNYLTNESRFTGLNEIPGISITKMHRSILAYRYDRSLTLNLLLQAQYFHQQNNSDDPFQTFSRNYWKFLPTITGKYTDTRLNRFQNNFSIALKSFSKFPSVEQLYPLVDSSNVFNIREGNPSLEKSNFNELNFQFSHSSLKRKAPFLYSIGATVGTANKYIADSVLIDKQGVYSYYPVNLDGYRYLNILASLNKALAVSKHHIQLSASASIHFEKTPSYLTGPDQLSPELISSRIRSSSLNFQVFYNVGDLWDIDISQNLNYFHSTRSSDDQATYSFRQSSTKFNGTLHVNRRASVNSNLNLNYIKSANAPSDDFLLWNASASYRFTKNDNLAVKFSALDLLHQNRGIINYGNNYSLTSGYTNALQQYFMLTLTFFPRKFGK